MNEIQTLPDKITNAGHEFSYASWSAGTRVTLANVPWNSDYRDLVKFDTAAALDAYLDTLAGPVLTIGGMSQAPMNRPIRLDIPFEQANRYNYLRAYNPAQPLTGPGGDTGRAYYYFIAAVNYVAPNTTEMVLQLDAWQTFNQGVRFGNCYIERGHVGIANEDQFADNGRQYLTQPEGLDVGGEYVIVDHWRREIASARNVLTGDPDTYSVMVTSSVSLMKDPGDVSNPKLNSSVGSLMENLPNGTESYLFDTVDDFTNFMSAFSDKPWITQGIQTITAIPPAVPLNNVYNIPTVAKLVGGVRIQQIQAGKLDTKMTQLKPSWRDSLGNLIPERYRRLKKLFTYPYTVLEMTSYTGTPLMLKPESWADAHATVMEIPHFAQPGARLMFAPYHYNSDANGTGTTTSPDGSLFNDGGEFLDLATGIFNFPQFSIVNNGYLTYLASNSNSIAYQHTSADWAQQRALAGNEVAAGQATGAIGTSQDINRQGINAATAQTSLANETGAFRAMLSMGQGAVNGVAGVAGGNPGAALGAVSGMAGAAAGNAIDINQRNQALGISNTLAGGVNAAQNTQAGYVRDTNKAYGDYAARGDYQNAIAGINAKVQDAKMIQPTTAGQVGGDAFLLAAYKWGYDVKVKMMQPAPMSSVAEYWLRYGYAVNRFGRMPESFMVCEKFTYWKLRETYITAANCPETFKQTLRGIFEKGVTVWKNPSDIGNIDIADNAPLAGVTL